MNIKEIHESKVLYLIDHLTWHYEILAVELKYGVPYFRTPQSFLTEKCKEFNNEHFRDMAQITESH